MHIYHITHQSDWEQAKKAGSYEGDSYLSEGFIHCSTIDQVTEVANRIFLHQKDLLILCINLEKLISTVKFENLEGGEIPFPHIYGKINLEAVENVIDFIPQENGTFVLPGDLLNCLQ